MANKSGKASRARRVEAVNAAKNTVLNGDSMPLSFDERQVRIYTKYLEQLQKVIK